MGYVTMYVTYQLKMPNCSYRASLFLNMLTDIIKKATTTTTTTTTATTDVFIHPYIKDLRKSLIL